MNQITPFSLKDAPSLIECVFPVQKISAEAYKEQEGKQGKILTTLGSYWKGRKPLFLNRACVLASLLPATSDRSGDLEVLELLLGMDQESMVKRLHLEEGETLPITSYREWVQEASRPEEMGTALNSHIWPRVNNHLGTNARSIPELVEQLGIMRFGRRPRFGDAFCGSGQIPFEAARLGCDVYASDLNPIAKMLTWGAFNIVGGSDDYRNRLRNAQESLVASVEADLNELGLERERNGWRPKTFLYCTEVVCPQTGWRIPLLQTLLISKGRSAVAKLIPNNRLRRFDIIIESGVSAEELENAEVGTLVTEGRGQEPHLQYVLNGEVYRTKISTIRGDFRSEDGTSGNRLRLWEISDFAPRETDIFQERMYAIHWIRKKSGRNSFESEFRSVSEEDLKSESIAINYLRQNFQDWQDQGFVPNMQIEAGVKTDEPIRTRGWTHWHHLFNPHQLLFLGLTKKHIGNQSHEFVAPLTIFLARLTDWSSKLCRYGTGAARESVAQTFYNQALNTLFAYGVRSFNFAQTYLLEDVTGLPIVGRAEISADPADKWRDEVDIFITDPPYGDAVKYEEILEFFIAWVRRNPPSEFSSWVWDSRRALAIKGEDHEFRVGMVGAYSRLSESMPDNGIQIIMFTHQSGSIWADMANIVWASGLQVTAAWYVVTEIDSALRDGSYVKGTVLLVLRKRTKPLKIARDELAWELQEEVEKQVRELTGLNQVVKAKNRNENLFEDADLQMAGYAAALRVLTKYSIIDGRDMPSEAIKPRVKGEKTFVDNLIEFAVSTANQALVPQGLDKTTWDKLSSAERFILKMLEMEVRGSSTLDNYQNFAKAFKVRDFGPFLESRRANQARLKGAVEFGRSEMNEGSELYQSTLRALYYAMWELSRGIDESEVLQHLSFNVKDYYSVPQQREITVSICEYLASKLEVLRPEEASFARIICDLVRNQRIG